MAGHVSICLGKQGCFGSFHSRRIQTPEPKVTGSTPVGCTSFSFDPFLNLPNTKTANRTSTEADSADTLQAHKRKVSATITFANSTTRLFVVATTAISMQPLVKLPSLRERQTPPTRPGFPTCQTEWVATIAMIASIQ